jgi:hypothetical protein
MMHNPVLLGGRAEVGDEFGSPRDPPPTLTLPPSSRGGE